MHRSRHVLFGALGALVLGVTTVVVMRAVSVDSRPAPSGEPYPLVIDRDAAVDRLAEAIRIPTVSRTPPAPPSDSTAIFSFHELLETSFPEVYRSLRVETVSGLSLLLTWPGSNSELDPILLTAHMDVVPAADSSDAGWTHPPFTGVIESGFVWGRGTLDNKGPLMAILEAVEALLSAGFTPTRTVLLAFGHDEEVGGLVGARRIARRLEDRGIRPLWALDEGLAVVEEGTIPGMEAPAALVGTQEKGYLTLRVVTRGEGGHSSAPAEVTAIDRMAEVIREIDDVSFTPRVEGATRELIRTLSPHLPLRLRLLTENLWLFSGPLARLLAADPEVEGLVRTTAAVTVVEAGRVENRVPARAEALVNLRVAPWQSPDEVESKVRDRIEAAGGTVQARAGPLPIPPSERASAQGEGFERIRDAVRRVFPDVTVVAPALSPAAMDARHYESVARNVYRFAPFRADSSTFERIHGTDERIGTADYERMIRFYAELIRRSSE